MWKELPVRRTGAVDRRKRRRATDARGVALSVSRAQNRQRAGNPSAPQQLAAQKLLWMMRIEPRFPFAVADLLVPVRFHAWTAVVPHERRRCKPDAEPPCL